MSIPRFQTEGLGDLIGSMELHFIVAGQTMTSKISPFRAVQDAVATRTKIAPPFGSPASFRTKVPIGVLIVEELLDCVDVNEIVERHASRKMVEKYSQMAAQNRISHEENSCLQDEKNAVLNYQNRLRDKFTEAMEKGTGLFRGVSWDASSLGKAMSEIYKKLYGNVVPDLYPI